MEWVSGNIFVRPNELKNVGDCVQGHAHNFDHTTFFLRGWCIVRQRNNTVNSVMQFCSPEYRALRGLQLKYEPNLVKIPVRGPDIINSEGKPMFNIYFINIGDPILEGFEVIELTATQNFALIEAGVEHELFSLADNSDFNCVYSHREPQGDIALEYTGFEKAYQFVATTRDTLDLRLKNGSALINAGIASSVTNTTTINGPRTAGTAPDIGAWESPDPTASAVVITGSNTVEAGLTNTIRVSTNSSLHTGETEHITFSDGQGTTFNPDFVDLSTTKQFAFITVTTTASLGARTITATATGTPSLTPATFQLGVVAPLPASTLLITGPATGVCGTPLNINVTLDHPLAQGETLSVALADPAGGTFSPNPAILTRINQIQIVSYTGSGDGSVRSITATPIGPNNLSIATLSINMASASPIFMAGNNRYTIGTGKQFPTLDDFLGFLQGKDLISESANIFVDVYENQTRSAYGSLYVKCNVDYQVYFKPAVGTGYNEVNAPDRPFHYPTTGIELLFTNFLQFSQGVNFSGFRIRFTNDGKLAFGTGYDNGGVAKFINNVVMNEVAASCVDSGNYGCSTDFNNNVFLRKLGSGISLIIGDGSGTIIGNTFVGYGVAQGSGGLSIGAYGGHGIIRDNAFVDCGPIPIVINGGNLMSNATNQIPNYGNNYSNVAAGSATTVMLQGLIIDTVKPFVVSTTTDVRPALNGGLSGHGDVYVVSKNDNVGSNRGTSPDIGALQRVPATPLTVITVTNQVFNGQTLVYSFSVVNSCLSATLILPAIGAGAVTVGPVPITLGTGPNIGTATVSIDGLVPGNYGIPQILATNQGGVTTGFGGASFTIIGIIGTPENSQLVSIESALYATGLISF